MATFTVDVKGVEKAAADFQAERVRLAKASTIGCFSTGLAIQAEARRNIVKARDRGRRIAHTGFLGNSIQVESPRMVADRVTCDVKVTASYGSVIEQGRRPGPISPPGMRGIERWVQLKLGLNGAEKVRATRSIIRKIRTKGFEGRPFFEPAVQKEGPKLTERVVTAYERMGRRSA